MTSAAPVHAPPNAEQRLLRLEWTVLRRLDGLLQGDYKTLLRGNGLDLADLREYQPHDDVRHIDWNVTARLQTPHVRVYTEDREMTAWFVLDLSRSMRFGSREQRKSDLAQAFCAALARLLTRRGNRVGALVFGAPPHPDAGLRLPARTGRQHVLRLMQLMHAAAETPAPLQAGHASPLGQWLATACGALRQRATVFVVSDYISPAGWEQPLGRLALRHDVVAVRLIDPLETRLPDLGLIGLRDAETGEQLLVDCHDPGFRRRYIDLAQRREALLRQALTRAGVDAMELSTNDDLANALIRLMDLRSRRVRARHSTSAG